MPTAPTRLLAALALALALSACGSPTPTPTPTPSESATASATPSETPTPTPSVSVTVVNTLEGITVTGDAGKEPTVKVPSPMAIDETRSTVLQAGNGNVVAGVVDVHYVGINGRTGETFDSSWAAGQSVTFPLAMVVPGFKKGLEGKRVGDRVLMAMTGADGYDAMGGNAQAGIAEGDTLVFVVDIVEGSVAAATGSDVAPAAGAPEVAVTDGKPVVTIPAGAEVPGETAVHPLITGVGRAVGEKDYVLVHYRSWSWKTGKLLEDKFDQADYGNIAETIPAWRQGVIGQPIGSRVLIVSSPADSYPEGSNNPPLDKGDTLVYVVDVLFASSQPWQ